jgi:cation diffusion facilitator CzcD-associated flavoprotein CzcO
LIRCGQGGVLHSFQYKDPEDFRGKRVLVVGCAISALEIASDLAMPGASRVVTTFRRQRYVMQKLVAGVPSARFAAFNAATRKEPTFSEFVDRITNS